MSVHETKLTPLIHMKACRVAWGFDTNIWESSLCLCSRTPPRNDHGDSYHLLLFQHSSVSSSFQMGFIEKMCDDPHLMVILKWWGSLKSKKQNKTKQTISGHVSMCQLVRESWPPSFTWKRAGLHGDLTQTFGNRPCAYAEELLQEMTMGTLTIYFLFQHSSVSSSFLMGIMEKMCDDPHLTVLLKWWGPLKSKKQNKTNYLKARFHVSVSERKLTPLIHIKACRVAWGFDTNVWESSLCLCSRTPPKNDHGDTYHLLLFQHSSVSSSFQMGITEKMCGEPHSNAIIWTMGYVLQTHIATSYPMLNFFAFQLYIV